MDRRISQQSSNNLLNTSTFNLEDDEHDLIRMHSIRERVDPDKLISAKGWTLGFVWAACQPDWYAYAGRSLILPSIRIAYRGTGNFRIIEIAEKDGLLDICICSNLRRTEVLKFRQVQTVLESVHA